MRRYFVVIKVKEYKVNFNMLTIQKIILLLLGFVMLKYIYDNSLLEGFYNITPTELIDPEYYNINQDPFDYKHHLCVGDLRGVDLNCNNVTVPDLFQWIKNNNPHLLHQYVYKYDPSINIENPIFAPRVLKMLLMNLPTQHPYIPIIRKCFPMKVRIS
jgi:hypothetical protein